MLFSKAIQIKMMVNKFNQERKRAGFPVIKFDCNMYYIGRWSVDLSLTDGGCFFSDEISLICTLVNRGGFVFFVGCNGVSPVLFFQ